jgi:hypothetical protein
LPSTIVQISVPTEASIPLRYLKINISHCHLLSLSITTSIADDAMKNVYGIYHIMWRCCIISIKQAAHMKQVKAWPVSVP